MAEDIGGDAPAEVMATAVGWHSADISADEPHGIAAVAHPGTVTTVSLGGAAVDDGDKVICDDDSVLAFPSGVFRRKALLDDFHCYTVSV